MAALSIDGQEGFLQSAMMTYFMNKVIAMDPLAIEKLSDWLSIKPYLGHDKGLFLAKFPTGWHKEFRRYIEKMDIFEFDDLTKTKVIEFVSELSKENGFLSLGYPSDGNQSWAENFINLPDNISRECMPVGKRGNNKNLQTFETLDSESLEVRDIIAGKFTPIALANLIKVYIQNSPKVAFVDRNNYLSSNSHAGKFFIDFIKEVLLLVPDKKCHQIIIYCKYDAKHGYLKEDETLKEALTTHFSQFKTPLYGLKYICCNEAPAREDLRAATIDLHARWIVTNNVAFQLSDSISGGTKSQTVTRIKDKSFREAQIKSWIDGDHGLQIVSQAEFVNN